jgi:hypothetical protein
MQCSRPNFDSVVRSQSSASSGSLGPLPQTRPAGESLESPSRTCSCPGASGDAGVLPHGVLHSTLAHS